jgi:hypothetical protein
MDIREILSNFKEQRDAIKTAISEGEEQLRQARERHLKLIGAVEALELVLKEQETETPE